MIPFLEGIALGASLIIAIGPQNVFVIQQGILRQHVFLAAFVCTLVDVVLIIVGAAGFGTLIAIIPSLKTYFLWGGILFLMGYGTLSLISSFKLLILELLLSKLSLLLINLSLSNLSVNELFLNGISVDLLL